MNDSSRPLVYKKGDEGQEVKRLQRALSDKGFTLKADGDFGPKTEAELERYQASAGLQAVSYTHLTLPTICSV